MVVVQQSSEVDDDTVDEANDEDKEETAASSACDCESSLPISSNSTTVATCEHSEQQLICGSSDAIAENTAVSGEMCLSVKALGKRSKKSANEDQTVRYPSITGTLSERGVKSVSHIVQVFYLSFILRHVFNILIAKLSLS